MAEHPRVVLVALGRAREGTLRARGPPPGALPRGPVVRLLIRREVPQRAPQPRVVRRHLRASGAAFNPCTPTLKPCILLLLSCASHRPACMLPASNVIFPQTPSHLPIGTETFRRLSAKTLPWKQNLSPLKIQAMCCMALNAAPRCLLSHHTWSNGQPRAA